MMLSSIAGIKRKVQQKSTMKAIKKYDGTKKETMPLLKHNKLDIIYWNKHNNTCFIIYIAVGRKMLRANVPMNLQHPIESGIMGVIEIS